MLTLHGRYLVPDRRYDSPVVLSDMQEKIMWILMARWPHWTPAELLADFCYSDCPNGGALSANTIIRSRLHHLRRKLEPIGWVIDTIWGQGYRLRYSPA